MRYVIVLALSLTASQVTGAECIAISDSEVEEVRTEYGMTTAEWRASITNSCDEPYDATITLHFIDQEGEVLHETLEVVIMDNNGQEDTVRNVTLPTERYRQVARTQVQVRERKRPT